MTIGMLIIYFLGSVQLYLVAKMSFHKALAVGVLPFYSGRYNKNSACSHHQFAAQGAREI